MKLTCPTSKRHKRFSVTAHVSETWEVDEEAAFSKVIKSGVEVLHWPDSGDCFRCRTCGADAVVSDEELWN